MGALAEQSLEIFSSQESPAREPFDPFPTEDIETSIPDRFEKIVRLYSDRLAVKMGDRALTYEELNRAANRNAGVIAWDREAGEKYLVGYVVTRPPSDGSPSVRLGT